MSLKAAPSTSQLLHLPLSPSFPNARRPVLPPLAIKPSTLAHDIAHQHLHLAANGLRTPPVDDMSTTYQQVPTAYDSHALRSYASAMVHPGRAKAMAVAGVNDGRQYGQYPALPQQQQQQQPLHAPVHSTPSDRSSKSTPASVLSAKDAASSRRSSEALIYHSLQIPRCISPSGGSLADFAAQMTCFFWFQPSEQLRKAESMKSRPQNVLPSRLVELAKPSSQFRKWVYNVLSTTQVTQNVILLALLFIYRLKCSTPQIKGRGGSEYRLLTVSLMLGNKFLDDNTYTNKTWAEVSCFTVNEIHVMEVEFLSNMRYNLLASKDEWEEWLTKLACFHDYYEQALLIPASPLHLASPSSKSFHSPMPSPTTTTLAAPADMAFMPNGAPPNFSPTTSRHAQNWAMYHANPVSPLAARPTTMVLPINRKRSPEVDPIDHPAKRHMRQRPNMAAVVPPPPPLVMNAARPKDSATTTTRLPVPHLTLVTTQIPHGQPTAAAAAAAFPASATSAAMTMTPMLTTGYAPHSPYAAGANQNVVSLPPMQTGARAMSTVYHHQPSPAATVPATTSFPGQPSSMAYTTPTKHLTSAYASSPMAETMFGTASGMHTPIALTPISQSPSVYLQQRASPYRPIRHVNRLLCPPSLASLDQYHLAVPIPPAQMHYQPLGRRNDLRTGVVPEFLVYNRGQQQQQQQQAFPQNGVQGAYAP